MGSSFAQTTDWYLFASYVSDLTPDEVSALAVAYPMKTGQLVDGATGSIAHTFTHVIDRNGVSIPVQSIPEYTVYMYATDGTNNGRDVQSASVTVSDQTTMLTISNMDYLNLGNALVVDWSVFDGPICESLFVFLRQLDVRYSIRQIQNLFVEPGLPHSEPH